MQQLLLLYKAKVCQQSQPSKQSLCTKDMQDDSGRVIAQGIHGQLVLKSNPSPDRNGRKLPFIVKIVRAPRNGLDPTRRPHNVALEVKILQSASHPNIVTLIGYKFLLQNFEHHLTLPLLAFSLAPVLRHPWRPQDLSTISRSIAYQALSALSYLHEKDIAHRDICPSNLLIDWDGTLRLIDFGTAYAPKFGIGKEIEDKEMVCQVGTGPYRAPEVLFGPTSYEAKALDLWALATTIAEFFLSRNATTPSQDTFDPLEDQAETDGGVISRSTLFDDTFGDIGLAASIFRVRGSPSPTSWPEFAALPDANKVQFDHFQPTPLEMYLPLAAQLPEGKGESLIDLLDRLLTLSPTRRVSAKAAMVHPWLTREPILVPRGYCSGAEIEKSYELVELLDGETLVPLFQPLLDEAGAQFGVSHE